VLPEVEGGAEVGPQTRRPSPALSTGSLATVGGSYTCERVEATRPKGRRFRAASFVSSLRGLLRRRFGRDPSGLEFFNTPAEAEAMLETVLEDEPDWRETLYIECVEFVTGGRN
jgi:hypothetical protein